MPGRSRFLTGGAGVWGALRRWGLNQWFGTYIRTARKRRPPDLARPIHVLLCVADHFEPKRGNVASEVACERVRRWLEEYPRLYGGFRDSDGRPPRHTWFYPVEEYEPE